MPRKNRGSKNRGNRRKRNKQRSHHKSNSSQSSLSLSSVLSSAPSSSSIYEDPMVQHEINENESKHKANNSDLDTETDLISNNNNDDNNDLDASFVFGQTSINQGDINKDDTYSSLNQNLSNDIDEFIIKLNVTQSEIQKCKHPLMIVLEC